jgi:hypothetical protein
MAFLLSIQSEDDFADIISKIRATGTEVEITMRVEKEALLFSDLENLIELKKRTDAAGKRVTVETADEEGASFAYQVGYNVRLLVPRPKGVTTAAPTATPRQPQVPIVTESRKQVFSQNLLQNEPEYVSAPARRTTNRTLITVFSVAMIALLLLAFVILPQADITVYAKTELLSRDMQVTVDTSATTIDPTQLVIPGSNISNPQEYSQTFQSTGGTYAAQNAIGTVQIYNFSGHVLKLGATTTTLTAGSETYRFQADATNIPVTKYYSGSTTNVDPGSLMPPVAVTATSAGDASNIPQGTRLEIKNTAFGSNPSELYAVSASSITDAAAGGTSATPVVSQTDLTSAATTLQSQLLSATEQQLLSSKDLTLLDSGVAASTVSTSFSQPLNAQAASFTGTINANVKGLAFSKLDLVKLVEARIAATLPSGMYLVTDQSSGNAETITETFNAFTPGSSTGILMVHVDGLIAANVDSSSFAQQFKGKSISDIQAILGQNTVVQGADVELKPFWVRSAPRFLNKIYITIKVEKPQDQG